MDYLLSAAIDIAKRAHGDQRRKYTNEPYISHPFAVAGLVAAVVDDEEMVIASILHDVVEDTHIGIEIIEGIFGIQVASYVSDMTDVSKPDDGNRAVRKKLDRIHTSNASHKAKTIKLADLIDNTKTIVAFDPGFAKIYMAEKRELLKVLSQGDSTLLKIATDMVDNYFHKES